MYKLPPNIVKTFASTFKKEKPKNKAIIRNLARDKAKEKEVKTKSEFELIYFWEYDINNNLKEVKECLMKLFL